MSTEWNGPLEKGPGPVNPVELEADFDSSLERIVVDFSENHPDIPVLECAKALGPAQIAVRSIVNDYKAGKITEKYTREQFDGIKKKVEKELQKLLQIK